MLKSMNRRRIKKYPLIILFIFSQSTLFAGCASDKASISQSAIEFSSPEAALTEIAKKVPIENTVKSIASIQMTTKNGSFPLKVAMMLKRPSLMRVEAIPILGPPNFFLSIHENHLKVFLPDKNEFYMGHATPENMALFLPLRIDMESMVSLLMGSYPIINGRNRSLRGFPEKDLYRIDIHIEGKRIQSLWIRLTDGCLAGIEVFHDEKMLYEVKFEEHVRLGGFVIPQKIMIISKEDQTTLSIRYRDIELTMEKDDTVFDLKVPPDIKPKYFP